MKPILEAYKEKFTGKARDVFEKGVEECKVSNQNCLSPNHILYAITLEDSEIFDRLMTSLEILPELVSGLVAREMLFDEVHSGDGIRVAAETIELFKKSMERARYHGRTAISTLDLMDVMIKTRTSPLNTILTSIGIEHGEVLLKGDKIIKEMSSMQRELESRHDVPVSLRSMGVSLNRLAADGKLPPTIGREKEVERLIEILSHKQRPNSALLIGDPGVGKTAVVEGLANLIEHNPERLPESLRNVNIIQIDMGSVVAGTMLRGMFEERIRDIVDELRDSENLILFIDEAHMIVGSGTAMGFSSDASNMFKTAMSRGQLRIIGATTTGEYKESIAEDPAFDRRFRKVVVEEPTPSEVRQILEGIRTSLQKNYEVEVTDDAIDAAMQMAPRYMRHMKMPDKVIGWLDTACVKAKLSGKEAVESQEVVATVSQEAKIPVDMVNRETLSRFKDVEETIAERIVGQKDAVKALAKRLRLNKGPLKDNYAKPDGVLMFLGPTGVGKTELAKALAEFLFGDEGRMIRVDMSEYGEGTVGIEKLIGMPRGIVGSEKGGVLTEQLRENPYSVVLLDEVEKANPNLMNLFLQAFDEGWLTDGRGRKVYLSEAIVIMTSNIGSGNFQKAEKPLGFSSDSTSEMKEIRGNVMKEFEQRFSPEFRNRIDEVIVFTPLSKEEVRQIASNHVAKTAKLMSERGKNLVVTEQALDLIAEKGVSKAYGARHLKRFIDEHVKLVLTEKWDESDDFMVDIDNGEVVVMSVPQSEYVV